MLHSPSRILIAAVLAAGLWPPAVAVDVHDTRLLTQPAVSADHVAFIYARDLWVADRAGGDVRRLTAHHGRESNPRFAPDGRSIAFSAEYDGNVDVFLVPVTGGEPQRLTWHPAADLVQGFTPNGDAVLFTSGRATRTRFFNELYTVPVSGGFARRLPVPNAAEAAWSPDGTTIAYTPLPDEFQVWKNYRGGSHARIWLYNVADHAVTEIPQPPERANDSDPTWLAETVYFLSDRNGEMNLFSYDPRTQAVRQHTTHQDFPVVGAAAGGGVVVYEQAGYLHLYDPAVGAAVKLTVGVAAELVEARPRYVSDRRFIRNASLSPSAARAVFEYRGEIVTVPAQKGSVRNLTNSPAVHERSPVWSPDGNRIAWFSDAAGEYALHVAPQDGKGEVRVLALAGAGFYENPQWSPDGTRISYLDNSWSLYVVELATGGQQKIYSEPYLGPDRPDHAWSPDSRWLAHTRNTATGLRRLFLYALADGRSHAVTDGMSDVVEPVFDAGGKYLYFTASTNAGPVRDWVGLSGVEVELTRSLYLAVLPSGEPSPLAAESDEESGRKAEAAAKQEAVRVEIDFANLDQRILALPLAAGGYSDLQAGEPGKLYYRRYPRGLNYFRGAGEASLRRFDLEQREEQTLLEPASRFVLSADGKHVLVRSDEQWLIAPTAGPIDPAAHRIDVDAVSVRIEPRSEWTQIYAEVWRATRDNFYDANMHGADWRAMREKYAAFLPHLTCRDDLTRLIRWLGSELSVSHFMVGGPSFPVPEKVPGGLLGADYRIDAGRYRFARVYRGRNWDPQLRAPLTEPGVEVAAGEYLLAVEGVDLRPPENLYRRFEMSAGRIVEITVGPDPGGAGARTVRVVPIENERALRQRDWVEGNRRKVDEATDGRVAYVYVPDTATAGYEAFKRYFFPQAHKEAIIIDERHNGGGAVPDYYVDLLRRPLIAYWGPRYGGDLKLPLASIQGPKVMIIDEIAGSGGDVLPWMFRQLGLGTLVGKRTWGGVVGILDGTRLMDGGTVTVPGLGTWTPEGFVIENAGVPPDVEVEQLPSAVAAGRDPQLEKAIEIVLGQLPPSPPPPPVRPPCPVQVRGGDVLPAFKVPPTS